MLLNCLAHYSRAQPASSEFTSLSSLKKNEKIILIAMPLHLYIDDKKVINLKITSIPAEKREISLFLENFHTAKQMIIHTQ